MVTKEAFEQGVLTYLDSEIIPHLSTLGKWGVGAFSVLLESEFDNVYEYAVSRPMFKVLKIVNEDGLIDVDKLENALVRSADRYGKLTVSLPVIGTCTFSKEDVRKLRNCMSDGGMNHGRTD